MKNKTCFALLFASVALCGAEAASVPPLDTIVPLGIGAEPDVRNVAEILRDTKNKTGIRRFALHAPGHSVRLSGCYDTEGYRGVGRQVKAIQDLVRDDGIEVGYLMGPTMNAGCNMPWRPQIQKDGTEVRHRPCPGDPAFQRDFAEHCAAVAAECRPFLYMMEDDFRYFVTGCLCADHLQRFGRVTGRAWTRESLLRELAAEGNVRLRVAWDDFLMEDMLAIARGAERAIHAVSPETRIGLSVPGALRTDRAAKLARVLAGRHRPFCRWQGAIYGYDNPMQMTTELYIPIWAQANVADGIESYYEADNCPGSAYYGSGAALVSMCSSVLARGFDGLWYWAARGGSSRGEQESESPCLGAYGRNAARLAEIRAEGRAGRAVGVSAPCNTAVQLIWPFGATANGRNCDRAGWARFLGHVGLPYTAAGADVTCYSGIWAFEGMSADEIGRILSGKVFLDGEAAEALTRRGYANLIGVEASPRDRIDFTGERVVASGRLIGSSFHQNYGLDDSTVTRLRDVGAEAVSVYYSGRATNAVQSSVTRFVNAKGGRVAVMALDLAYAKARNLYNDGKRDLVIDTLRWLGGDSAVPVRTDRDVLVFLTANEDAAKTRLFVHTQNLSGDPREGLSFVVAGDYRGGTVEILDGSTWRAADCTWKGERLTVRAPLHLFDTMVLKIANAR